MAVASRPHVSVLAAAGMVVSIAAMTVAAVVLSHHSGTTARKTPVHREANGVLFGDERLNAMISVPQSGPIAIERDGKLVTTAHADKGQMRVVLGPGEYQVVGYTGGAQGPESYPCPVVAATVLAGHSSEVHIVCQGF